MQDLQHLPSPPHREPSIDCKHMAIWIKLSPTTKPHFKSAKFWVICQAPTNNSLKDICSKCNIKNVKQMALALGLSDEWKLWTAQRRAGNAMCVWNSCTLVGRDQKTKSLRSFWTT